MKTMFKYLLFSIFCSSTFFSCQSIDPDAPSISEKDIPIIQQPASKLNIPITIDLKNYFKQVETSISNTHSDSVQECQGLQYAYMLKRSPFSIKGFGNSIQLSFQGNYWIKLSYCADCESNNCTVPRIGASCGLDEPLRKINIAYASSFKLLKNYRVHSSTSLVTLKPLNKCKVTKLNIDATDKLINYVKDPLTALGTKVDEKIARIDFKPQVQRLWEKISQEIRLGQLGFLTINPIEISANSINIYGTVLKTSIDITAKPFIRTESHQQPENPLPELSNQKPGNGFDIYFDITASYDSLSIFLNKKLAGRTIHVKENELIITNSTVYGIGNQKVVFAIDFKGTRKGRIYFTGTPNYNTKTNVLTFPDLTFDSKTMDLLLELNTWVYNDEITKWIRESAKFNFSNLVNKGKQKFEEGINRNLGDKIHLSGEVNNLIIRDVYPHTSKLLFRALAHGKMALEVKN